MTYKKNITVQYFATLREQAGSNCDEIETTAQTAEELYSELAQKYAFSLSKERVKVAINDTFAELDTPLAQGDTVVFIPPVSGG